MRPLWFAVSAVLAFACSSPSNTGGGGGGSSSGGGGGGSAVGGGSGVGGGGMIADPCNTICTKLDLCDPSDGGVAACTPNCQTFVAPFRTDYTQALARCTRDTACADLFVTTMHCDDGGMACSGSTSNTCVYDAGTEIPDSVLDGFYNQGVCPHLISCGTVSSDVSCHAAFSGLPDFTALKAYPDSAIDCTGACIADAGCSALSMLDSALNDCASKTCGIHLSK